jgi:predicted phosphohydrolase
MKIAWCTDVHLDSARDCALKLASRISCEDADAVLLTGDISNSIDFASHLTQLQQLTLLPIYYVAGNHDYYGGSIKQMRKKVFPALSKLEDLVYLTQSTPIRFGDVALVGCDGWYDTLAGNYNAANFVMNDWRSIEEFMMTTGGVLSPQILNTMKDVVARCAKQIARDDNNALINKIDTALADGAKKIIIATHVPPYVDACMYRGTKSGTGFLPWYCNASLGALISERAEEHENVLFEIYSGHTHGRCRHLEMKNVLVNVGDADYGDPKVQFVFEILRANLIMSIDKMTFIVLLFLPWAMTVVVLLTTCVQSKFKSKDDDAKGFPETCRETYRTSEKRDLEAQRNNLLPINKYRMRCTEDGYTHKFTCKFCGLETIFVIKKNMIVKKCELHPFEHFTISCFSCGKQFCFAPAEVKNESLA